MKADDIVITLGVGKSALAGYNKENHIIAGIRLITHPSEWPDIFQMYPIKKYLQHSDWTVKIYQKYYGVNNCTTWPVGIDTNSGKKIH